jgi:hypothetical protein
VAADDPFRLIELCGLPSYLAAGPTIKQLKPQAANPYINPQVVEAN